LWLCADEFREYFEFEESTCVYLKRGGAEILSNRKLTGKVHWEVVVFHRKWISKVYLYRSKFRTACTHPSFGPIRMRSPYPQNRSWTWNGRWPQSRTWGLASEGGRSAGTHRGKEASSDLIGEHRGDVGILSGGWIVWRIRTVQTGQRLQIFSTKLIRSRPLMT